jgi:hypothetical protein
MKLVQVHPNNTSSTSVKKNRCELTFLEWIFPKLHSRIENFNYESRSIYHGFTITSNSTNSRSKFARTNITSRISHYMAKFLNFPMNLTMKIGDFSQFHTIVVTFYHGRSATQNLATSKLILCDISLQLNLLGPSKLSVEN